MSVDPWLDRLVGQGQAERRLCVWVPSLAGLRGTALQSEYCAVLCRLWGCGQHSRDCAWLGSGAQEDRAFAGLCRPGDAWTGRVSVCGSLALMAHPIKVLWD
jgi:hypothetical protein